VQPLAVAFRSAARSSRQTHERTIDAEAHIARTTPDRGATIPAVTRTIDAVQELLAPLIAATPGPTQWRLVDWDADAGVSITLARADVVLLIELEAHDEARPCYGRTQRFNVLARRIDGVELGNDERRAVDRLIALVGERETSLPAPAREDASARVSLRTVDVDRVLIAEGPGRYYLNPYVGCVIGCEFCYAAERADLSRAIEGLPRSRWGRWVDVKVGGPAALAREIAGKSPGIVRLSPIVTDPYQPLERKYRVTRGCLEVLLAHGFTPVVLTRSAVVLDDLELLGRFPRAAVGLSIPTDDDSMRAAFEPGADPIDERLRALEALASRGITTFAVVQPMLPMDPEALAARLAPLVSMVRIDRMYELARVRPLYERAGRLDAMEDTFFEETERALREALERRGVRCDGELDLFADRRSRLARSYDRFYRGDSPIHSIVGLSPSELAPIAEPRTTSMLRYDRVREIDLVALERGVRPAIKIEDLDKGSLAEIETRLRGFVMVRSAPYKKRFDAPESDDRAGALVNLYVSRDPDRARAIAEAELDRSRTGTVHAGLALGYPPCCVEAFAALERSAATYDAGLNEAALRAFAGDGRVPWELHPLSSRAPIGFTPCARDCPAALELARRILAVDPAYEATRRELERPILFFRYPIFWVLEGAKVEGARVRYERALLNDDGAAPAFLRSMAHRAIGAYLERGRALSLDGTLEIEGVIRWELLSPRVPILFRFE
jgi:DNA repair photolyase